MLPGFDPFCFHIQHSQHSQHSQLHLALNGLHQQKMLFCHTLFKRKGMEVVLFVRPVQKCILACCVLTMRLRYPPLNKRIKPSKAWQDRLFGVYYCLHSPLFVNGSKKI
jgi:hypothetical protein